MPAASAHVLVDPGEECHAVRADLEALLARHGITHATLQVDHMPDSTGGERAGESDDPAHCEDAHGPSYRPGG
jgi:cobalt-zinc-cadmium efflux system protein